MPKTIILTVMGADRPGLVARLAATVADHGGNWIESRLVRLGGQFAGVLRVEVPEIEADALAEELQKLEDVGLRTLASTEDQPARDDGTRALVTLDLIGSDRPGILKGVSTALARQAANIEELSTGRSAAPMSGELLFQAHAVIQLPPAANLPSLRADLEKIAADLMVDLHLTERTTSAS